MLETGRLILRQWREEDLRPFAEMNADPEVMEHFPAPLTRAESDALAERARARLEEHGFGLWAVEVRETGEFAGFTGLVWQRFEAPFTPAVEVGWRLRRASWGRGYATEAAGAALDHGFGSAGLTGVISMTAVTNLRSQAVMRRLGMTRDPAEDFDHPGIPPGGHLRPHVLYRLRAADWPRRRAAAPARGLTGRPA
ncbi:N-acetyltransferase [Sphaerisporangium album]|uniref:N-acetyltransferase n=1 Tax=Sphaerisporangium album TaxID=509200 RepID=A0A367FA84_9ACTN|nr:GNAT family N-acetyltransferase [Sphaerisporangium album]RCG26839.1 N-acetyltransferase [Sphaerisporangium album]